MDATLKELNLMRSIKKFWVDGLPTYPVYFDKSFSTDRAEDQWLGVSVTDTYIGQVSNAIMSLYLFSKKDREGYLLTALRDAIVDVIDKNNGCIPFYNTEGTPWVKIGGILIQHITTQEEADTLPHETKLRIISSVLKWSALW